MSQPAQKVPRRTLFNILVNAIRSGQKVELTGKGSRAVMRQAEKSVAQSTERLHDRQMFKSNRKWTAYYGPVWTGRLRSARGGR